MKMTTRCVAAVALVLTVLSCGKTSVEGAGGKKLTLTQPASQTLKRGETNPISIAIGRTGFSGVVGVRFTDLPKGTTVVEDKKIAADASTATYTLHAAPDADLVANSVAKVTAEGPDGMSATATFQITVKDKN